MQNCLPLVLRSATKTIGGTCFFKWFIMVLFQRRSTGKIQHMEREQLRKDLFRPWKRYLRLVKTCLLIGMDEMMMAGEGQKWIFTLRASKLKHSLIHLYKGLHALKGRLCKLAERKPEGSWVHRSHLWPRKLLKHKGLETGRLEKCCTCYLDLRCFMFSCFWALLEKKGADLCCDPTHCCYGHTRRLTIKCGRLVL